MKRVPAITLALAIGFPLIAGESASYAQDPSLMSCNQLWHARNQIYAAEGYCFKTRRAQAVFGTSCFSPYGRLKPSEARQVNILKFWEHKRRCSSVRASQIHDAQLSTPLPFDPSKSNGSVSTVPIVTPLPTPPETAAGLTNETLTQLPPEPPHSTAAPSQAPPDIQVLSQKIIAPHFLTPMTSAARLSASSQTTQGAPATQSTARINNSSDVPSHTDREYEATSSGSQAATSAQRSSDSGALTESYRPSTQIASQDPRSAGNGVDLQRAALLTSAVLGSIAAFIVCALLVYRFIAPMTSNDRNDVLSSGRSASALDASIRTSFPEQTLVSLANPQTTTLERGGEDKTTSAILSSSSAVSDKHDVSANLLGFKRINKDGTISFYRSEIKASNAGVMNSKVTEHRPEFAQEPHGGEG